MYNYLCPQCGKIGVSDKAAGEVRCGACGCQFNAQFAQQVQQQTYGPQQQTYGPYQQQRGVFDNGPSGKNRGLAGLFAILLGTLGIHYFYVGKTTAGIVCLILGICSCGLINILTLIQGILMLTMTEEEFERRYVYSTSTIPF